MSFSFRGARDTARSVLHLRQPSTRKTAAAEVSTSASTEVLLQIFEHLVYRQPIDEDLWLPGYYQSAALRAALLAAMLVSRSWYAPAAEIFYYKIEPRTVKACNRLAKTLERRPDLAARVRCIVLPEKARLLGVLSLGSKIELKKLFQFQRLAQSLAQAVENILKYCVSVEDVRLTNGADEFACANYLEAASGRLKSLTVTRQIPYEEDTQDIDGDTAAQSNRTVLRHYTELKPTWNVKVKFDSLQVLRFSHFMNVGVPWPPGFTIGKMPQVYPQLSMLALANSRIMLSDLKVLLKIMKTLRTLSISNVSIWITPTRPVKKIHPLKALNLITTDLLELIEDVRVFDVRLEEALPVQRFEVFGAVTRLTLHPSILSLCERLPSQLQTLTLYYWDKDRTRHALLYSVEVIVRGLDRWTVSSPGFHTIILRAPNATPAQLPFWTLACSQLVPQCLQRGISVQPDIW